MITVGAFEAKTKFSELLDRAAAGETIVVTRHGRPVARIEGIAQAPDLAAISTRLRGRRRAVAARLRDAPFTAAEIAAMIAEGRR